MTETVEFEVAGVSYQAQKLNAFEQCDVAVLLGPVFSGAAETLIRMFKDSGTGGDPKARLASLLDSDVSAVLGPLTKGLAQMSREDRHFVLTTCLSHIKRAQVGAVGWAPVTAANGMIMFQDIAGDMTVMIRLAWKVIEISLLSFSFARSAPST